VARSHSALPLRPAEPASSADLRTVLSTPLLDLLDLPARVAAFAYAAGLETIGDLARIPPETLLGERNLGRTSIAITRRLLEERMGVAWEEIACPERVGPPSAPPEDPDPQGWDAVRRRVREEHRLIPLTELDLPLGLRDGLERRGVLTLGDLAQLSRAMLIELPGIGRQTMVKLPRRVTSRLDAFAAEHADRPLLAAFMRALDDLEQKRRIIVRARCGLDGPRVSNTELARTLGISGERVRQLEARAASALRDRSWALVAVQRVDTALGDGPVPFAFFANDPWWVTACEQPLLVSFIVERVLDDLAQVVYFDGAHWLSRQSRYELEETWAVLGRASEKVDADELVALAVARVGPCRHFLDRFLETLAR
jgi:hypothetical protein